MKYIKVVVIIWLSLWGSSISAQQEAQFTQYMYNPVMVNPAYAGSRGFLSVTGLYRSQWTGIAGSPRTLAFSAHDDFGKVGLGLSVLDDQVGPATESNVTVDFAYAFPISQKGTKWAFGIKAGMHSFDLDFSKLNINNPSERILVAERNEKSPQFGVGTFLYGNKWYLGLSTPNLLETEYYDDNQVSTATSRSHFYFMGGYVFELSKNMKFKPAATARMVQGSPLALDVSANAMLWEALTLGVAYRLDAGISGLMAIRPSKHILIGYGYDFETSALNRYSSGSHEFFVRFDIFGKDCECAPKTPRFF